MDGVFFNKEHREWLSSRKISRRCIYAEEEGSVPYTPTARLTTCTAARRQEPTSPGGVNDRFGTERVARPSLRLTRIPAVFFSIETIHRRTFFRTTTSRGPDCTLSSLSAPSHFPFLDDRPHSRTRARTSARERARGDASDARGRERPFHSFAFIRRSFVRSFVPSATGLTRFDVNLENDPAIACRCVRFDVERREMVFDGERGEPGVHRKRGGGRTSADDNLPVGASRGRDTVSL